MIGRPRALGDADGAYPTAAQALLTAVLVLAGTVELAPALAAMPENVAEPEADTPVPFEAAMEMYETCHWTAAFALLSRLADQGDPRAARLALLMARHGLQLYGTEFPVTALQAAGWIRHAASRFPVEPAR